MNFNLLYEQKVIKKDIPRIAEQDKKKIKEAIENKLMYRPEIFGKPLRKSLKGYRKLRVGEYMVIFRIENNTVRIFVIQHRREIYKNARTRL